MNKKKYDIRIKEASEILGVSLSTVRKLIREGRLNKRYGKGKRGRAIYLDSDEVKQLKEKGEGISYTRKAETVSIDLYSQLKQQYEDLLQRYEAVIYRLGYAENRLRELEAGEGKREEKKSVIESIKSWFRKIFYKNS